MGSKFKALIRGEEPDSENDPASIEETYERLFPKIGRDFIHRDDFVEIISDILLLLGVEQDEVNLYLESSAIARAMEYKSILESGDDGSEIYSDLIDLGDV